MSSSCVHTEPKTSGHRSWKFDGEKILIFRIMWMNCLSVPVLCRSHFYFTFVLVAGSKILKTRAGLPIHPTWGQHSMRGNAGASPHISLLRLRVCALWASGLEWGLCLSKEHTLPLSCRSLVFIYGWITLGVIFQILAIAASKLC